MQCPHLQSAANHDCYIFFVTKLKSSYNDALQTNQNPLENIENLILNIRGKQVMLDRDLARLYGVGKNVVS